MTHPSPTAELTRRHVAIANSYIAHANALTEPNLINGLAAAHQLADDALTHIAALKAELAEVNEGWRLTTENLRLQDANVQHYRDRAEKAEAQLATRLPDREVLGRVIEGVTIRAQKFPHDVTIKAGQGIDLKCGPESAGSIADAILALLSGAATPAPTAALTEEEFLRVIKPFLSEVDKEHPMKMLQEVMSLLREKGVVK